MSFSRDIEQYVLQVFGKEKFEEVLDILRGAKLHDGQVASERLVRCMLIASQGTIDGLVKSVELLAIDFRDVIMCGEYEIENGESVRIRDLTLPFSQGAA